MSVTLEQFKNLCESMSNQKKLCEDFKKELEEHQKRLDQMKSLIIDYLDENGLNKFVSDTISVTKVDKVNVKIKDKDKFFEYLRKKGLFESLASVNSNTLNAFYRQELEGAIGKGDYEFHIPGIEESSTYTNLQIRKNK